jgi:hypothetical protein
VGPGNRFVRAWLQRIGGGGWAPAIDGDGLEAVVVELRALAAAVAAFGPQTLALERITVEAPSAGAIEAARNAGARVDVGGSSRGRYQVDLADGAVWTVAAAGASRSYDNLDDLIATNDYRSADSIGLGAAVDAIGERDAIAAPEQRARLEAEAREAIEAGRVGLMPVAEIPAATAGEVIAAGYEAAFAFSEGRALIQDRGRWGYIDRSGAVVIEPRFGRALGFYEGLAAVSIDGKWGFVDADGELAIEPRFATCGSFRDGRASVHRGGGLRKGKRKR